MGVQGLWSLVSPAARPTPLESLRRKRLAVDASIWIHQFMRTMRDKEGNALRNGHLLGFFRRLCKLLFFDIKPVFVFDGGAPFLKKSTIKERRQRREGLKANLKVTAKKIFNAQVRSRMLLQHEKKLQAEESYTPADAPTAEVEENYVYVEELEQKAAVEALRKKRKLDQYELPEMDTPHSETYARISKNNALDPRLATKEEIQSFVDDFAPSINTMDIDNEAFQALPLEMQYEIIQDLKWKSRSTSHARLEDMVKKSETAMDFSKQQIQNLQHRNDMTQRLMQVSGLAHLVEPTRVASERGRQYILCKNENVKEGLGWTLPGLEASTPVDLDPVPAPEAVGEDDIDSEVEKNKATHRFEPKLVIPTNTDFQLKSPETEPINGPFKEEKEDPVAAALSSNPKLAALMDGLLGSDSDEDVEVEVEGHDNDDAPLFIPQTIYQSTNNMPDIAYYQQQQQQQQEQQQILDDQLSQNIGSYMENSQDTVKQVVDRIYKNAEADNLPMYQYQQPQQHQHTSAQAQVFSDTDGEESYDRYMASLTAEQLLEKWLSQAPDAFIYLNSMNDAYKSILRSIVEEEDIDKLKAKHKSIVRQRDKTNADKDLTVESLDYQARFIEEVVYWREAKQYYGMLGSSTEDDDMFEDITPEQDSQQQQLHGNNQQPLQVHIDSVPSHFVNKTSVVNGVKDTTPDVNTISQINVVPEGDKSTVYVVDDNENSMILSDDEDEQAIQFIEVPPSTQTGTKTNADVKNDENNNEITSVATTINQDTQHVHIDIEQSSLFKTKTDMAPTANAAVMKPKQEDLLDNFNDTISFVNKDTPADDTTPSSISVNNAVTVSHFEQPEDKKPSLSKEEKTQEKVDELPTEEETTAVNSTTTTTVINEVKEPAEDQGYNSEEELANNMQGEEAEYLRFVSDIATKHLDDIKKDIQQEVKELNALQRKTMGNTDDITDQMVQDTQELLRLFGIPYIIAPMEAEAQCAKLEELNLVDGTITDDSDVFLFGAKRVYKNVFNQQKYVECYLSQDIEREMLLTRKKLIQLAYLLGSDYTEGIPGIGPVAAMEILNEFSKSEDDEDEAPIEAPLLRFKRWYESNKDETPFQKKFRKRHNNLDIPDDFPNLAVVKAYYHPTIDDSADEFIWGQPELDSLRIYLMESFSWSEEKADQVLLPVLREMNSRKTTGEQSVITSHYFADSRVISSSNSVKHSSKRVRNIVENWRKQKKLKE